MAPLLSIIIPVYNVGKTLEGSLQSIRSNMPEAVELVFVNDGSSDCTAELLDSFRKRTKFPCRIISQENAGVAAARNTALDAACGKYLVFLDADDKWKDGAPDRLLALTEKEADVIGWDFASFEGTRGRVIRQADYSTPEEALRNLMGGTMKWNLWLYAIKRELVTGNQLRFLPGANIGEDMQFMLKAFSCASHVLQVHEPLYCYNASNPDSISAKITDRKMVEITRNLEEAEAFVINAGHSALWNDCLPHLKLFLKRPLLISLSRQDYETWYGWFPEANAFATLNTALPYRVRLLQGLAARRLWLFVQAYNLLVYRLAYPLLLRFRQS